MGKTENSEGKSNPVPWDEVGREMGTRLVADVNHFSQLLKQMLEGANQDVAPDFSSNRWRYEFCIWQMFWVWYVANSPRLAKPGATHPLLDAYHRECYLSMNKAGLIGNSEENSRAWEADLLERFTVYKGAFDSPPKEPIIFKGTIGWLFSQFLYPGKQPNPHLAIAMRHLGSKKFQGLVDMIDELEEKYRNR